MREDRVLGAWVAGLDWARIGADLAADGWALTGDVLPADLCAEISGWFGQAGMFRSHIVMARHGFGSGEYKYFAAPLPGAVQALRAGLYPHLAAVANGWGGAAYPADHSAFVEQCRAAGQCRPTPLLLRYVAGDFNCLHQDLYGSVHFPLQVAFLLDRPGEDFTGGEFVLTEQRPRRQSRVEVIPLRRGEGVIFAVNRRPVRGARGVYPATMRHGVSRVRWGVRHTLGVIFHDAA